MFYDKKFSVGTNFVIGKSIKVDTNTLFAYHGRFAQVSIEINIHKLVVRRVNIRDHWHQVEYVWRLHHYAVRLHNVNITYERFVFLNKVFCMHMTKYVSTMVNHVDKISIIWFNNCASVTRTFSFMGLANFFSKQTTNQV